MKTGPCLNELYLYNLIHMLNTMTLRPSAISMFKDDKIMTCEIMDIGLVKLHIWKEIK